MQEVAARLRAATPACRLAQPGVRRCRGSDGMLQWMLQAPVAARPRRRRGTRIRRLAAAVPAAGGPRGCRARIRPAASTRRWQALLRAQEEYQHIRALCRSIKQALDEAFALFEQRLAEHTNSRQPADHARAMSTCGSKLPRRPTPRSPCPNRSTGVRLAATRRCACAPACSGRWKQMSETIGLPTRSEMDAAHRRIADWSAACPPAGAGAVLAGTAEVVRWRSRRRRR